MRLEAESVWFSYGRHTVLSGVSLSLEQGERVGLWAPSGQGKTTLCRLLAGYERPQKGRVLLEGKPLSAYGTPCSVQMVWQHPETVVDPLLPLGKTLAEAAPPDPRLLEALHIQEGWLSRFPSELSGGELQRFCLARTLHPAVRFLLCDEITAMLDLVTQAQMWDFLLQEAETRQLGLLIVSHSRPLLERVCTPLVSLGSTGGGEETRYKR